MSESGIIRITKGSVKDIRVMKEPTESEVGLGNFVFSDRYSIFDWGEMSDHIPGKGESLCLISSYFFEILKESGVRTTYLGVVEDGEVKKFSELEKATNTMSVELIRVIRPAETVKSGKIQYDYSKFAHNLTNFLVPLEVIYRNRLPKGSSVFRRLKEGTLHYKDLELNHYPEEGEILQQTYIDVSTKLEKGDRYIGWEEAQKISGLNGTEIYSIKNITHAVNSFITDTVAGAGIINEDGKIEFAVVPFKGLAVADAVGTLDECRFTFNGKRVSKEILRQWYEKNQPEWVAEIKDKKSSGMPDWKEQMTTKPMQLPKEQLEYVSNIYMSAANAITGRNWFNVPRLEELIVK
ncbi:MAG TPA: phosphoribosylaminoimidazolesuccinocarboxamide synthase [Candidatus Nanoarchaeia archaeon]|nr:phosphoribosylaminoimidazolesuccinocarboxamide synthase [Candidatus Nanoarchaeia archaeon]